MAATQPPLPNVSATAITSTPTRPAMTPSQRALYSRPAEGMTYYHNHFKSTWAALYAATAPSSGSSSSSSDTAPSSSFAPTSLRYAKMSPRAFIRTARGLLSHLSAHHGIEEAHIFPLLAAKKMPGFTPDNHVHDTPRAASNAQKVAIDGHHGSTTAQHDEGYDNRVQQLMQDQHRLIHAGMDGLASYLDQVESGERELRMSEARAQMDTWGPVLMRHLDEEIQNLAPERFWEAGWTTDEMRVFPM